MSAFRMVKRLLRYLARGLTAIGLDVSTTRIPDDESVEESTPPPRIRPAAQAVPVPGLSRDEVLWEAEPAGDDAVF